VIREQMQQRWRGEDARGGRVGRSVSSPTLCQLRHHERLDRAGYPRVSTNAEGETLSASARVGWRRVDVRLSWTGNQWSMFCSHVARLTVAGM